jgi:hypothetical protein
MGATFIGSRVIADAGDIHREFTKLRRERALFQLSLDGDYGLVLTTHPDQFVVAASYEDHGYLNEPFRAKIIVMDNMGVHTRVPFDGSTPDDLIDTMLKAHDEYALSHSVTDA